MWVYFLCIVSHHLTMVSTNGRWWYRCNKSSYWWKPCLHYSPLGDVVVISKVWSPKIHFWLSKWALMKLLSGEYHRTPLMISQHWFRLWLGAVRQQAITWANIDPDLCHYDIFRPQWVKTIHRKLTLKNNIDEQLRKHMVDSEYSGTCASR